MFRILRILALAITMVQGLLVIILGVLAPHLPRPEAIWLVQAISPLLCSLTEAVILAMSGRDMPWKTRLLWASQSAMEIAHCGVSTPLFIVGRDWGSPIMCLAQHACAVTTHLMMGLRHCEKSKAASETQGDLTSLTARPTVGPIPGTLILLR